MRQYLIPAVVAVALSATAATAQVPNQFTVGAHAGYTQYGDASALENEPFIGVDAVYRLANLGLGGLDVGFGFTLAAARPKTRGDQFPVVAFDFGDTTFLSTVAQRVTMLQYGLQGVLGHSFGRVRLYGMGGGGAYTTLLDSRQNVRSVSYTKPMGLIGGGLEYAIGRNFGFRFEARDMLDPTIGYTHDRIVRDVLPPPDPAKSTIHNIQASVVFTYVPNRRGVAEPEVAVP
jgi:hypothetical protein